jgi:hypothetical protein
MMMVTGVPLRGQIREYTRGEIEFSLGNERFQLPLAKLRQFVMASLAAFAMLLAIGCGGNSATMPSPTKPSFPASSTPQSQQISAPAPPTSSTDPIVGQYALTMSVGPECATIPEMARTRSYTATIDSTSVGSYAITLSNAAFRKCGTDNGCHQFIATREGNVVRFDISVDDNSSEGAIWEFIPPSMWLEVTGTGSGRLEGSTIAASLDGGLWYCPGSGIPCLNSVGCKSSDIKLTFTR